jgi:hypothetical protein
MIIVPLLEPHPFGVAMITKANQDGSIDEDYRVWWSLHPPLDHMPATVPAAGGREPDVEKLRTSVRNNTQHEDSLRLKTDEQTAKKPGASARNNTQHEKSTREHTSRGEKSPRSDVNDDPLPKGPTRVGSRVREPRRRIH